MIYLATGGGENAMNVLKRCFLISPLVTMLTGCGNAIPLPQDVTTIKTVDIVQKIRCEMKKEVQNYIFNYIKQVDKKKFDHLAVSLYNGEVDFADVKRSSFSKGAQSTLNKYDGSTVTYDFTFDMTEDNNGSIGLDLARPFTRFMGSDKIGLTLGAELKRENIRLLKVRDNFADLLSNRSNQKVCKEPSVDPNYVYPITGKLGLEDQVGTFLNLNDHGNLSPLSGSTSTAPALSDNIKFTTKFSGGVNPGYQLTPLGKDFHISNLSVGLGASREDVHQVLIVMALPLEGITKQDVTTGVAAAVRRSRENNLIEQARGVELIRELSRIGR